ncbi:hypothetical protein AtEden1_Chr00c003g0324031 [Arabidopsis thaliana]
MLLNDVHGQGFFENRYRWSFSSTQYPFPDLSSSGRLKGVQYVIYWKNVFLEICSLPIFAILCFQSYRVICSLAMQFVCSDTWDVFHVAEASFRTLLYDLPSIKIYDEDVTVSFLLCGPPCPVDTFLLGSLMDGLNALLRIEVSSCSLHAPAPPLQAGTFTRGVVTMRCDVSTCSSAHISMLVSGNAQTCFSDQARDFIF